MADRWIFTQFAFNVDRFGNPVAPYIQCLAISTTGDPTGTYYRYAFQISTVNFNDYPKLAVWPDAYYMTFNYFNLSLPPASQFQGAGAWAFDRTKMLNGQPATAINFQTSATYGGLLASDLDGSIAPPAGSPNYVAAIDTPVSFGALAGQHSPDLEVPRRLDHAGQLDLWNGDPLTRLQPGGGQLQVGSLQQLAELHHAAGNEPGPRPDRRPAHEPAAI